MIYENSEKILKSKLVENYAIYLFKNYKVIKTFFKMQI